MEETPEIITLKQLRYYFFNDRVTKALEHIDTYRPPVIGAKWLTEMEPGNAAASSDNPSPFSR